MSPRNPKFAWQDAIAACRELSHSEKGTAFILSRKDNGTGAEWWYSQADLAYDCGASEKTIERHLAKLQRLGFVRMVRRGGRNGRGESWATVWELTLPEGESGVSLNPTPGHPQPDISAPQPDTGDPPLDPLTLDPGPLDPGSKYRTYVREPEYDYWTGEQI